MAAGQLGATFVERVNDLREKSSEAEWLQVANFLLSQDQDYEHAEAICNHAPARKAVLPVALGCVCKRLQGHNAALQLLLCFCTACTSNWWHQYNFHQVCIGLCFGGTVSQRVLSGKCLQAMCLQAASSYPALKCLHEDGVTEWALKAMKRHATSHDRPELFMPAVTCLSALLPCQGARELILSGNVPAMLQKIHGACRLNNQSVNAYSSLLQAMQRWLVRPRRAKRLLPLAAPAGAAEASKAFQHLQAMAQDSDAAVSAPTWSSQQASSGSSPPSPACLAESRPPPSDAAAPPHSTPQQARHLQDLREAGLDVDALPASLLHLFMDEGAGTAAASSDTDSE